MVVNQSNGMAQKRDAVVAIDNLFNEFAFRMQHVDEQERVRLQFQFDQQLLGIRESLDWFPKNEPLQKMTRRVKEILRNFATSFTISSGSICPSRTEKTGIIACSLFQRQEQLVELRNQRLSDKWELLIVLHEEKTRLEFDLQDLQRRQEGRWHFWIWSTRFCLSPTSTKSRTASRAKCNIL